MSEKVRTTVSLDRGLVEAAQEAVERGEASSVSAWVSDAISERVTHLRRLRAMADALADYEAEHGVITPEEIAAVQRADAEAAIVVRGGRARP